MMKNNNAEFCSTRGFHQRYIDNAKYPLDDTVGLDSKYPYPEIIYIPDNPEFCKPYNKGESKSDCSPTMDELGVFQKNSLNMLMKLNGIPAPWSDS
jgi:hypothetical protein